MLNLTEIARKYNTDKATGHSYTPHYDFHFSHLREKEIKLLEIGVGGYSNPEEGGGSLKMWKEYFSKASIFAFDIEKKNGLDDDRIKVYQGSQTDGEFMRRLNQEAGGFDIIIDDGSHFSEHVIYTFQELFPLLNKGGIYVVEDTQTSYWRSMGGDYKNPSNLKTTTNYFKHLSDGLNHKEYVDPGYQPTYMDTNIISIHFYHNLIFIYKGENTEESNVISNNCGNTWAF
jgi:hypothetical protein